MARQLIVSGGPGAGKSHYVEQNLPAGSEIFRVQFHAESSYFDFVGTYKPTPVYEASQTAMTDARGNAFIEGRPIIDYRFVPGPLVRALIGALRSPDRTVVLIIEELNRGNAAAIFGDILQLLDRGDGWLQPLWY